MYQLIVVTPYEDKKTDYLTFFNSFRYLGLGKRDIINDISNASSSSVDNKIETEKIVKNLSSTDPSLVT